MKGPLWFTQFHRRHHRRAERWEDVHSPWSRGFLYSHVGWFLDRANRDTDYDAVRRWARFPELVWLDKYCQYIAVATGAGFFAVFGWSGLLWGYLLPTLLAWHGFKSIGSFCHGYGGYRRFATPDRSCNNPLVSLFTFGEGLHNNHHVAPYAAKLSYCWWEVDPGWTVIRGLERLGLVWNVKRPPAIGAGRDHLGRFAARLDPLAQSILARAAGGRAVPGQAEAIRERFAAAAAVAFRDRPSSLPKLLARYLADLAGQFGLDDAAEKALRHHAEGAIAAGGYGHLWRRPRAGEGVAAGEPQDLRRAA